MNDADSPDGARAVALVRERLKAARDRRTGVSAEAPSVDARTAGVRPAVRPPPGLIEAEMADTQWGDTVFDSTP